MQHAVVGFEFTGDELLEGGFIPFREGLTVVYGLNGAGKTRLIEGMRAALTGVKSEVGLSLLVRLHTPTEQDLNSDSAGGQRAPGVGLLLAIADQFAELDDYSFRDLRLQVADGIINRYIREAFTRDRGSAFDANVPPELVEEVAADRLFLMHPAGTSRLPSWEVWPVADLAGEWVAAEVDRLAHIDDAFDEDDPDGLDVFNEAHWRTPIRWDELLVGSDVRLMPRTVVPYSGQVSPFEKFHGFSISGAIDFGLDVLSSSADPNSDTIAYIGEIVTRATNADPTSPSRSNVEDTLGSLALELEMLATKSIQEMLLDAPEPALGLAPAIRRFSGPAAQWSFRRARSQRLISLDGLSRAERIWAGDAIAEALYWHRRDHLARPGDELRPIVAILDEPESALHRSAEAHTARALVRRATDPRKVVIAATHSPELLDVTDARILEVKRDGGRNGRSIVRELDLNERAALDDLGLTPSDLLRWPRVFLLVEGAHDEALLDAYFGNRLRAARVQILPLRGVTKLPSTIDSRVLFDSTEAHLVALVDNHDPRVINAAWAQALANRQTGTLEAATSALADAINGHEEEARFLREWLTAALRRGLQNRVTPYSLQAKDIIEYVPVGSLIQSHTSWDAVRSEHAVDLEAKKGMPRDFKKWIERRYDVHVTPDLIRTAAQDSASTPAELEQLMKALEAIAQRRD